MKILRFRSASCAASVALIGISSVLIHPRQARADFDPSQYTFTTIDHPMATGNTIARGISGNTVVGFYYNGAGARGFMYDGSTYTDVNHPLGTTETVPCGVSAGVVAGYYRDSSNRVHGFTWDGSTYTTIDYPLAGSFDTTILGISGNRLAGYYYDGSGRTHGFVYDGSTFTTLDHPDAIPGSNPSSQAQGVSGNAVEEPLDEANIDGLKIE